jgi:hypothetical protein
MEDIKALTKLIRESDLNENIKEGLLMGINLQISGAANSKYAEIVESIAGKDNKEVEN